MIIPVPNAGQFGLVTDQPFSELPLNAWTRAQNVRFREGSVEKFAGHEQVFPGNLFAPVWLLSATQGGQALWAYASETAVGATDGTTHADITRTGGPYNMSNSFGWTFGVVADIPVLNNGTDVPQMWNKPSVAQKLDDLSNWPDDMRAATLRALKRYLVALDVSVAGTRYPTMIRWSDAAPSGGVPDSWDIADETRDAGEWILDSKGGFLVDGVGMRDVLILYKEFETWQMQYIGGNDIFRFSRLFETVGMLSRRCCVELFGRHYVFTGDDFVRHDGNQPQSLIDERVKRIFTTEMNQQQINKAFVTVNYPAREIWVCLPGPGQEVATFAMCWNWVRDTWGRRELPGVSHIQAGMINPQTTGEKWSGAVGTWATDNVAWGDRASDPTKQRLVMASLADSMLYTPEQSQQFNGADMHCFVERQGLGIPVSPKGPPDYTRMKQITGLWPRISGTPGGVVKVSVGTQARIDAAINYGPAQAFVIGESSFLDFSGAESARIHALKFESDSNITWKLQAYDVDVIDRGMYG